MQREWWRFPWWQWAILVVMVTVLCTIAVPAGIYLVTGKELTRKAVGL